MASLPQSLPRWGLLPSWALVASSAFDKAMFLTRNKVD
jgi:hypothetical protein